MSDVTHILNAISDGDSLPPAELLPLVYDELRKLAAARLSQEKPGQTLQATALVHEAYLRLVDNPMNQRWNSRRHFFGAAAEAMRRILIDNARRKRSYKHGGGRGRQNLLLSQIAAPEMPDDLIEANEALDQLAKEDPAAADLVKLRYFAGFTIPEAAEILGVSPRQADFLWSFARAWLRREVGGE
jgi:RNA polymerase sigma factor (TIGR02999 family)